MGGDILPQLGPGGEGGEIPVAVAEIIHQFEDIPFHSEAKTSYQEIVSLMSVDVPKDGPREFYAFGNTGIYSPAAYFAPLIGVGLASQFTNNPLRQLYAGRVVNWLCWIALVFAALRLAPVYKWGWAALALLPMSLFLAASLSPDTWTNALCLLWFALIAKLALDTEYRPAARTWLTCFGIAMALALAKPIYVSLLVSFLLIPSAKFGGNRRLLFFFAPICILAFLVEAWWIHWADQVYAPHRLDVVISPKDQLAWVLERPGEFLRIEWNSFWNVRGHLASSFLGILGWLDTPLPNPLLLLLGSNLACLLLVPHGGPSPRAWQKLTAAVIALILSATIGLALYLHWSALKGSQIEGFQGRYFWPAAPLAWFVLHRRAKIAYGKSAVYFSWAEFGILAIGLAWMLLVLSQRYYA